MRNLGKGLALVFAFCVLAACGGSGDEVPERLALSSTTTTTTTTTTMALAPEDDGSENAAGPASAIDVSADEPAARCGIENPMLGEIELLPNDYLAIVASPGSLPNAAFDRMPTELSLSSRSVVCLQQIEAGATRGCGVQVRADDSFTLHLEAVTFVATVVVEGGGSAHQAAPMHLVEDCPGDPNDANPTLYPVAASLDVRVEPSVVGRSELFDLVSAALAQWEMATSEEPFSANRCESLGLTVERLQVLHDDLAAFFGSDGSLFPPATPAATPAHATEVQDRIDWFGEASSVSLVRFEGDTARNILAGLHLNMILWNDVAEAVAERQGPVPEELHGAWLHWRLGNAMRSSSIAQASSSEALLALVAETRCSPDDLVVSDADSTAVCGVLQKVYDRRSLFRENSSMQLYGLYDWLGEVNELHPPGLNPFFDPAALEALISVEYEIDSQLRYGTPMDRSEVAANEAAAEPLHAFVETRCSNIPASVIRLESALEAVPEATAAEVAEHRAVFCDTLRAFTEQRAIFRSGIGSGAPQGDFPAAQREAWDALRRLAVSLEEQRNEHGASIEPDPTASTSLLIGRLDRMVELENALRLWVFSEHPVPVEPGVEWREEDAAEFVSWGEENCSESMTPAPSLLTYDIEVAPDTFLTGFPSEAEVAAVFCPNVEDALHARLAFQHQLVTFDLTDEDRVSDLWMTSSRFRSATYSIERPYELNGGDAALAYSFTSSVSDVLWSTIEGEPLTEWEQATHEQTAEFLDDLPRVCPDLSGALIDGLGSMEELAAEARLNNRPASAAAFGERLEVRNLEEDGTETVWAVTVGAVTDHTSEALANGAVLEGTNARFMGFDLSITLVASSQGERWVHGDIDPIIHFGNDWVFPWGCELDEPFESSALLRVGETATGAVCGEVPEQYVVGAVPAVFNGLETLFFG